jgi:hypothetical protein
LSNGVGVALFSVPTLILAPGPNGILKLLLIEWILVLGHRKLAGVNAQMKCVG